jgi:hypothetical protein
LPIPLPQPDAFPHCAQEPTRPGELGRQDGDSSRDHDDSRPWQDHHRNTEKEHRPAHHEDDQPTGLAQQAAWKATSQPQALSPGTLPARDLRFLAFAHHAAPGLPLLAPALHPPPILLKTAA